MHTWMYECIHKLNRFKFKGELEQYCYFRAYFDSTTAKFSNDKSRMLEFLFSICESDALHAIRDCRWHGDPSQGLSSALEILEGAYGFLGTDAVSCLGPIRKSPSVPMTKDGLQKFLVAILSSKTKVQTLEAHHV